LSALACAAAQFGDYWRLGLPLSVMVAVLGTWLITIVLGFTQQSVSKATFSKVS
jgi:di/tricarboxylate transporter